MNKFSSFQINMITYNDTYIVDKVISYLSYHFPFYNSQLINLICERIDIGKKVMEIKYHKNINYCIEHVNDDNKILTYITNK